MSALLTRAEAAQRLRISLATLDRRIADGKLKPRRNGRRVLLLADDVELMATGVRPRRKQPARVIDLTA